MKATLIGPMTDLNRVRYRPKIAQVRVESGGLALRLVEDGGLQALVAFESAEDAVEAALEILKQCGVSAEATP